MSLSPNDVVAAKLACILAQSSLERTQRKGGLSSVGYQQLTDVKKLREKLDKYIEAERIEESITIA